MSTDPVTFLLAAAMRMPRGAIERLTEGLIAGLDAMDGDPDIELNGDELDTCGDEGDYSINERADQAEPIEGTGNDQLKPGTLEDAEDDDPIGKSIRVLSVMPTLHRGRRG